MNTIQRRSKIAQKPKKAASAIEADFAQSSSSGLPLKTAAHKTAAHLVTLSVIGLGSLSPQAAWSNCVQTINGITDITVGSGDLKPKNNAEIICSGTTPLVVSINPGKSGTSYIRPTASIPWASDVRVTIEPGASLEPLKPSAAIVLGERATISILGQIKFGGRAVARGSDLIVLTGDQTPIPGGGILNEGKLTAINGAIISSNAPYSLPTPTNTKVFNSRTGSMSAVADVDAAKDFQIDVVALGDRTDFTNEGTMELERTTTDHKKSSKILNLGEDSKVQNSGTIKLKSPKQKVIPRDVKPSGVLPDEVAVSLGGGSTLTNDKLIAVDGPNTIAVQFGSSLRSTLPATLTNNLQGVIDASKGGYAVYSANGLEVINRGRIIGGSDGAILIEVNNPPAPIKVTLGDGSELKGTLRATENYKVPRTPEEMLKLGYPQDFIDGCAQTQNAACYKIGVGLPQNGSLDLEGNGSYSDSIRGLSTLNKKGAGKWTLDTNWKVGAATQFYNVGKVFTADQESNFRGTLAVNVLDASGVLELTGAISDNADGTKGQVTKTGPGALTLSGANTYSGPTDIQQGTLNLVGSPSSQNLKSAFAVAGGAELVVVSGQATIGSLEGGGTVSISGTTLGVGQDNRSTTFSGTLAGPGALVKQGTGSLTLTGTGSGGLLSADSGSLIINGSFQRNATVASAALLGGSGTLASLENSGRVAPGNSVGTLNLTGDYDQKNSGVFEVEIRPDGSAVDLLAAAGRSQLAGGLTVRGENASPLTPAAAGPAGNPKLYTILTGGGGVNGQFTAPAPLGAFSFTTAYNANSVQLGVVYSGFAAVQTTTSTPTTSTPTTSAPKTGTKNQFTKAKHVDQVAVVPTGFASGNTDMDTVLLNLANVPATGLADAYNSIIAEPYAAFMTVLLAHNDFYAESVFERAQACSLQGRGSLGGAFSAGGNCDPAGNRQLGLWADATWTKGKIRGSDGLSGYHYRMNGLLLGLDTSINRDTAVGFSTGFASPGLYNYELGNASIRGDGYFLSGYGSLTRNNWELVGLAGYSRGTYSASRGIQFGNINRAATGTFGNHGVIAAVKAAYFMPLGDVELVPEGGLTYSRVRQNGFTETGADSLNLQVDNASAYSVVSSLGTRASVKARVMGLPARLQGLVRYDRDWSANRNDAHTVTASLSGLPTLGGVSIVGQNRGPNSLLMGGMATLRLAPDVDLFGGVNYRWTTNGREIDFSLGIRGLH